ncbi:MAG: ADP-ribosylglycohydrolase family protein [Actinomycetota bacterium]|nr:ADP-ribosylglycohydrolase family protein [Actinomycetota bacterium]
MTTDAPPNYAERVRGSIISAAVGDALGWPQEARSNIVGGEKARAVTPVPRFRSWDRNSGGQFARYQETVQAGEYSDDTQLLLAVARSCLAGQSWLPTLTRVELPAWTLYPRGAGRAVISAARSWAHGHPPWTEGSGRSTRNTDPVAAYFGAGANGVAMRIAPHVAATIGDDVQTMLSRVIADGIATHGHFRALVGAAVHALALRHALRQRGVLEYGDLIEALLDDRSWQVPDWLSGVLPDSWLSAYARKAPRPVGIAWLDTVQETRELLAIAQGSLARAALANDEQTLEALGCYDRTRNGSGTITAVAAAYIAARSAARPMTGLLRAAFLPKADTDTLASMAASLLGAIHGAEWLGPLASAVQDASHIEALGNKLASLGLSSHPAGQVAFQFEGSRADPSPGVSSRDTEYFRRAAFPGPKPPDAFVDGRRIVSHKRLDIPAAGRTEVERLWLHLEDGQTIALDNITRRPADDPRPETERRKSPAQTGHDERARNDIPGPSQGSVQVTLQVHNLDDSLRFYRDILGLPVHHFSANFIRFANGITLTLVPEEYLGARDAGARNILVTVSIGDVTSAARRVRSSKLGIVLSDNAEESQIRVRDPDGHQLRLVAG